MQIPVKLGQKRQEKKRTASKLWQKKRTNCEKYEVLWCKLHMNEFCLVENRFFLLFFFLLKWRATIFASHLDSHFSKLSDYIRYSCKFFSSQSVCGISWNEVPLFVHIVQRASGNKRRKKQPRLHYQWDYVTAQEIWNIILVYIVTK